MRSGVKRREALRMLAAATGTAATGSLILSQPAHADSGSESCRYEFDLPGPVATFTAANTVLGDFFGIDMTFAGNCPCGSVSSIEYAYYLDATSNDASTGSGWVGTSAWNAGGLFASLWPGGGGTFTVYAGVRVTCTGPAGTTVRCRYATSASISIGGGLFVSVDGTLTLGSDNGGGGPSLLPACDLAAPFAARALLSESAVAGGVLMMRPGPLVLPDEVRRLQSGESPDDLLGNPLAPVTAEPAVEPGPTTTPDTSTTTTSPETASTTTSPASPPAAAAQTSTTTDTTSSPSKEP